MAQSLAFNKIGSSSKPLTNPYASIFGAPKSGLTNQPAPASTPTPQIQTGNNAGLINQPKEDPFAVSTAGKTVIDNSGTKTITNAPKSNPNVLKQQEALNRIIAQKGGTPLVLDGIAGGKTNAALTQYGNELYGGGKVGGVVGSSDPITPTPTPTETNMPPKPTTSQASTNPTENAQNLLNTGLQTDLEKERLSKLDATQSADAYNKIQDQIAQNLQKQTDLTNEYQNQNANLKSSGIDLSLASGQQGILANKYNAGLGALSSQGAGLSSQLGAANTLQGLLQSSATTGLNAAQTQASRAQGVAGSVLGAGLLNPTTQGLASFTGLGGYQGSNADQFGNPTDPATAQNKLAYDGAVQGNLKLGVASTEINRLLDNVVNNSAQINSVLGTEYKRKPIETLLQYLANGTLGSTPELSGLANNITAIKDSYKLATGSDLEIPQTVTGEQLSSISKAVKDIIKAKQNANQTLIDKFKPNSNTNSSNKPLSWDDI